MAPLSPLHAVYNAIAKNTKRPVLSPEEKEFSFRFAYPLGGRGVHRPLTYQTLVLWDEEKRKLTVSTAVVSSVAFQIWEGAQEFFVDLTDNVQPFLEEEWPGGQLMPFCLKEDQQDGLHPGHFAALMCPEDFDYNMLLREFKRLNGTSTQALLFSQPIFNCIAKEGRVPDRLERMRTLSIEFGYYELSRPPERGEKTSHLPRGFFGGIGSLPLQ